MAIKALDLTSTREIVSRHDPARTEADGATVWIIGALDSGTSGRIKDSTTSFSMSEETADTGNFTTSMQRRRANREIVAAGLRGFRNFLHPDSGDPVEYKTVKRDTPAGQRVVVADSVLDAIPLAVVTELAEAIESDNSLGEEEMGN